MNVAVTSMELTSLLGMRQPQKRIAQNGTEKCKPPTPFVVIQPLIFFTGSEVNRGANSAD